MANSFNKDFRRRKFTDYFILSLLIATSANPFFFDSNEFLILGFIIALYVFFVRRKQIDANYVKVCLLFLCLEFLQYISFGNFTIETFLSLFLKLTFAYFVIRCLEYNFFIYYVKFIYTICLISLFFYGASFLPGFYDFFYNNVTPFFDPPFYKSLDFFTAQRNIIIYTFEYDCYLTHRNPGPFWEPGIFSIFIIIALIFNIIREKNIWSKTNSVLIITQLTTTSTAGYLGLFLLLFFYYLTNYKVKFKFLYLLSTIGIAVYLYYSLSFLSEKVIQNVEMSDFTGSRFGSLAADWALFVKSPWIGWGRGMMRYGGEANEIFSQDFHRNNGLAALFTQYGVFLSFIYFYLYFITFKLYCTINKYNTVFALLSLVVIVFVSFSQVIYTRQFFLSLLFLGLHIKKIMK